MIIPPSMLIQNSKKGGIMKTRDEQLNYIRKLSIGWILNSKKENKLIRIKKKERTYLLRNCRECTVQGIRKEIETQLDNSNIILNAYSK